MRAPAKRCTSVLFVHGMHSAVCEDVTSVNEPIEHLLYDMKSVGEKYVYDDIFNVGFIASHHLPLHSRRFLAEPPSASLPWASPHLGPCPGRNHNTALTGANR